MASEFEQLKKYFDKKFEALSSNVEKHKPEKITLKSRGNQNQLNHECKVLALLSEIMANIRESDGNEALSKTKDAMEEVNKRIN